MSNQLSHITLRVSLVILLALAAIPAFGQQRRASSNTLATQSLNEPATVVFRAARDLITDGEWAKAQDKFREYVGSYPNEKNIDAALYWMAYAQHKLGRFDQSRETIGRLLEKYPNSTWRDDARTLLAEAPGAVIVAAQADEALAQTKAVSPVAISRPADGSIVAPAINGVASTSVTAGSA
ncbi:MAG TPA: tetratricopeptide repeat protein, partial [Pyrinomonadaceae bacterium]|nr:tetratricopeptide repeat protein [Pyrinomonadaceae bacterium]